MTGYRVGDTGNELVGRTPGRFDGSISPSQCLKRTRLQRRLNSLLPTPETISSKDNLVGGTVGAEPLVAAT
jgi:hypothetical protein